MFSVPRVDIGTPQAVCSLQTLRYLSSSNSLGMVDNSTLELLLVTLRLSCLACGHVQPWLCKIKVLCVIYVYVIYL